MIKVIENTISEKDLEQIRNKKLLRKRTLFSDVFNNTFQVVWATAVMMIIIKRVTDKILSK